jgi:hypothetical protein
MLVYLRERMARLDARNHLGSLVGKTVWTATRRQPNRILGLTSNSVIVATDKSPAGQAVPLEDVQMAFDRLAAGEEVPISVPSLGYRSAFVGAAMLSVPGATVLRGPTRVELRHDV